MKNSEMKFGQAMARISVARKWCNECMFRSFCFYHAGDDVGLMTTIKRYLVAAGGRMKLIERFDARVHSRW